MNTGDKIIIASTAEGMVKNAPYLRKGQCIFNIAYEKYPTQTDLLRGSQFDPYYNDSLGYEFLEELQKLINK
jgi:hypothetical protein